MVLFMIIAIWGVKVYRDMVRLPSEGITVHVTGRQWMWSYQYSNGVQISHDLVVPVGTNILLDMTSTDVVHSFFVPTFRIKKDVVPGMRTSAWFNAVKVGEYRIYCAEFCGTSHSKMFGWVKVLSKPDYEKWITDKAYEKANKKMTLAEMGKELFDNKGCATCHTTDGGRGIGPTFKKLWGRNRVFEDGTSLKADANYIRESLMDPKAKVVKGFAPRMTPYQGLLTEDEVTHLIEFIKTLKN